MSLQGSNEENYERAIWVGYFVFIFYYVYSLKEESFEIKKTNTVGMQILPTLMLLAVTLLGTNILTTATQSITNFDYCEGWAYSRMNCDIQKIKERNFNLDNYLDY